MEIENIEASAPSGKRVFLFLQGPTSGFFHALGRALRRKGHEAYKVNVVGGDVLTWPGDGAFSFHGRRKYWSSWIARLLVEKGVTDLMLMGDWRALHIEAVDIARLRGVRIFVFEEGYLRPNYVTMEPDGVNGRSSLPRNPELLRALAAGCAAEPEVVPLEPHTKTLFWKAVFYHTASVFLFPLFLFYKNHRPSTPIKELFGWSLNYWNNKGGKWTSESEAVMDKLLSEKTPYFLFPLQLEGDSQVRRYSPFSGMLEAISHVLTSFAQHASPEKALLIKNHPFDNRLQDYATYIREYAKALNISNRVFFIESGNNSEILQNCEALVLLNSTIGLSALAMKKPVYCLGRAIYAMPGLAASAPHTTLDQFWASPAALDEQLLDDLHRVLTSKVLINGNFYSAEGIAIAVRGTLARLLQN